METDPPEACSTSVLTEQQSHLDGNNTLHQQASLDLKEAFVDDNEDDDLKWVMNNVVGILEERGLVSEIDDIPEENNDIAGHHHGLCDGIEAPKTLDECVKEPQKAADRKSAKESNIPSVRQNRSDQAESVNKIAGIFPRYRCTDKEGKHIQGVFNFSSDESIDEDQNDPDFDIQKEVRRNQLKRMKRGNKDTDDETTSDEMDDDSEVNIATCSKIMKRKRNTDTRVKKMRLDKDLGRSFNSKIESCSNGKAEFLQKEQSEDENVETMSNSVDSDESDVWPMLKQSSVKGDTNDVHENRQHCNVLISVDQGA
jgi:hypothetical protein